MGRKESNQITQKYLLSEMVLLITQKHQSTENLRPNKKI